MHIGDRIKALREKAKMTAAELAVKLGKGESAIRMWEAGKSKPDIDTLAELSKIFSCTTDYLLGLNEFTNNNEEKELNKSMEFIFTTAKKDPLFLSALFDLVCAYEMTEEYSNSYLSYPPSNSEEYTLDEIESINTKSTISAVRGLINSVPQEMFNMALLPLLTKNKENISEVDILQVESTCKYSLERVVEDFQSASYAILCHVGYLEKENDNTIGELLIDDLKAQYLYGEITEKSLDELYEHENGKYITVSSDFSDVTKAYEPYIVRINEKRNKEKHGDSDGEKN